MSFRQRLKDSYFVDSGNTTKAGIIDYLFKNRAPYLLIDEIDKMSPRDQTFLLNLIETGIVNKRNMERPGMKKSKHLFLQRATILENYPRRYSLDSLC
jgi:hypothetical protein